MILALLAALQIAAADSLPLVTLAEALAQGVRLEPNYVRSLGGVNTAEWGRNAALSALVLPSLTATSDYTLLSREQFNLGTGQRTQTSASARLDARLELFTGGRKLAELSRARAELDGAQANELQARYAAALLIENAYYDVLGARQLLGVATSRLRRAEEQLVVARARVTSGAAVQSDSLQLRLELTQARVAVLRTDAALLTARLELGRRVGRRGAVDAVPLADLPLEIPLKLPEAITEALQQGPEYRVARATERQADASLRQRRAAYLPTLTTSGSLAWFDETWFPNALNRATLSFGLSFPIWDNAQRELNVTRARSTRDVSRAVREDLERGVDADVTTAYTAFVTARAALDLEREAVLVGRENFRVQDTRYRAGASTILDLLAAQDQLTQAEANVVRADYAARLALAGLEAILGRRLLNDRTEP
jgi:outer membrane protein TolC